MTDRRAFQITEEAINKCMRILLEARSQVGGVPGPRTVSADEIGVLMTNFIAGPVRWADLILSSAKQANENKYDR